MALKVRKGVLRNRIAAIGVELEGGWGRIPKEFAGKALKLEHDGSVKFEDPVKQQELQLLAEKARNARSAETQARFQAAYAALEQELRKLVPRYKGEIPSPKLAMEEVEKFILDCYPSHVNATCGLHVHMSFLHRLNYQRLMTPEFGRAMIAALLKWAQEEELPKDHPIWDRVTNPKHQHCSHEYLGDKQVHLRKKDYNSRGTTHSRYTAINYCYSLQKADGTPLNTVECRLLPMMETAPQAVRGVKVVLNQTNRFLAQIRERERRQQIAVPRAAEFLERYEVQV